MVQRELKEFVHYLTHNKSLTKAQQLKRDELLISAIANEAAASQKVDEDAQQANDIDSNNISILCPKPPHRLGVSTKVEYFSPKNLQHFLRDFNQDEILKYTCHLIDSDEAIEAICRECNTESYLFKEHINIIKKHFKNLTWKHKESNCRLNPHMITLISVYLTGEDFNGKKQEVWSGNDVKENWACDEILQWAERNPGIIPNPGRNIARKQKNSGFDLSLPFRSLLTGKPIISFSDLAIFFKSQFHIRQDNSLLSILKEVNKMWEKKDVDISFNSEHFNHSIEIFTDVDKLIQAYKNIIKLCKECRSSDVEPIQIELEFYDDAKSKQTYFTIHHKNSVYKKTSKNSIERIGTSHSELISNQINGLCDLFVEAKFGDGIGGTINLWDEKKNLEFSESAKDISGVKYILRF